MLDELSEKLSSKEKGKAPTLCMNKKKNNTQKKKHRKVGLSTRWNLTIGMKTNTEFGLGRMPISYIRTLKSTAKIRS